MFFFSTLSTPVLPVGPTPPPPPYHHHRLEAPRLCSSLLQPAEQLRRVIGDDDVSACAAKHKDTAVRIVRGLVSG